MKLVVILIEYISKEKKDESNHSIFNNDHVSQD